MHLGGVLGHPRVAPALAPVRRMPRGPAVERDLDGADPPAAGVGRGARDRRQRERGGADDRGLRIDDGARHEPVRRLRRGLQRPAAWPAARPCPRAGSPSPAAWRADGRLLAVVRRVEPPRPLHGAGAEHERVRAGAVRVPVHRQMMRARRRARRSSPRPGAGRRRSRRWWRSAPGRAAGCRCPRPRPTRSRACRSGRTAVAPAAAWAATDVPRHRRSRPSAAGTSIARSPALTVNSVPVSAFSGVVRSVLAGAPVAPRAGPLGRRVDLLVRVRLLVGDERAVVVRPARLPEHLVAAEEGEVHAGVARGLDVAALLPGPVLVVADGQERAVLQQLRAAPVGVRPAGVAHVVAVALQPAEHRELGVEHEVLRAGRARRERPVVADLVRPAGGLADVERVAAELVVGLPRGVGGLEQHVGAAVVVADDEGDVALGARRRPRGGRGRRPRRRRRARTTRRSPTTGTRCGRWSRSPGRGSGRSRRAGRSCRPGAPRCRRTSRGGRGRSGSPRRT